MKKIGEESHTIYATIRAENIVIRKVKCKIYLPTKSTDTILLKFEPTFNQSKKIEEVGIFSIYSKLKQPNGYIDQIKAENIIWETIKTRVFAPKSYEISMIGNPENVSINTLRPDVLKNSVIHTEYWITENPFFLLNGMITYHSSGEITINHARTMQFSLGKGFDLTFKKHYKYFDNNQKETISFSEVVATCKLKGNSPINTPKQKLKILNDFLLMISFGSRKRCSCVGWSANNDKQITEFYSQRHISSEKLNDSYEPLIERKDIKDFLRETFNSYKKSKSKESLYRAINCLIPDKEETIESSFMTLYAGLETMVTAFRHEFKVSFVLSDSKEITSNISWENFAKDLKDWMKKDSILKNDPSKRKLLYDNLSSLNRISFRVALDKMIEHYKIDLTDLWSITDNRERWSLSKIRNKLVHGETFGNKQYKAIWFAGAHLRWGLERIILAWLEWDISKSRICHNGADLKSDEAYTNWKEESKNLV